MAPMDPLPRIGRLYLVLCIFRLVNAWLIQTQFDPDEYWQTLEPAYCEVFSEYPCTYTWEWTRRASPPSNADGWLSRSFHGPIRSYVSVLPSYIWYKLVKWRGLDVLLGSWVVSKGPILVHAILVAAPIDLCIWLLGRHAVSAKRSSQVSSFAWWPLFLSLTSWFQAYGMIRTYSNSMDAMLLAVGVTLVGTEFLTYKRLPYFYLRSCLAFWLGGLSTAVRFTALAAWVPLGVILALQHFHSLRLCVRYLFLACAVPGLLGIVTAVAVDRCFYGFWTVPFLGSLHFNVILGHGSLYGTHPFHWYMSSGIPAITGLMLPLIVLDAYQCVIRGTISQRNIWVVILCYICLHSFSAHKEFRFLLPILPLLCVRAGYALGDMTEIVNKKKRPRAMLLVGLVFVVPNVLAFGYLGLFHQRAPIEIQQQIREYVTSSSNKTDQWTVHYLLGCHATPLYSHLHVPGVHFEAWTLDCSPSCRQDDQQACESERFHQDPVAFVEMNYRIFRGGEERRECSEPPQDRTTAGDECIVSDREVPDLLVVMAAEAAQLQRHLSDMGLEKVAHAFQGINELRLGTLQLGDDFGNEAYRHVTMLNGLFELQVDEMFLYASRKQDSSR